MAVMVELARTKSMVLAHTGPVLTLVGFGDLDDKDFDIIEKHEEAFAKVHQRFFFLTVITKIVASSAGTQITKRRGHPLLRRFAPQLAGAATVISATGIGASVARSFTSAFNLMAGVNVPMRVFGNVEEAFVWCSNLPNCPVMFGDPARMAEETFALMGVRSTPLQRAL